jgi:hypothetical protein
MSFFFCIFAVRENFDMQRYEEKSKIKNQKSKIGIQCLTPDCGIELLSHIGFLVAIGLAAWFHYLRSTFGESAMVLYNLICEPNFWASSTWFSVNWFQNAATILAVKMKFSISLVSVVFSASPTIFAYLVFLITYYGFKRKFSGVFLLLLLFGINFTFFGAVNSAYTAAVSWYAIVLLISFLFAKQFAKKSDDFRVICETFFFFPYLFILLQQISFKGWISGRFKFPTILCSDTAMDELCLSSAKYLFGHAINTHVVIGCLAVFLCLMWVVKKKYRFLTVFLSCSVLFLLWMVLRKEPSFIFDHEYRFMVLVALVLILLNGFVWERFAMNKRMFGILTTLVCLAIGGQLRNLELFEKRQSNTIRLLIASDSVSAEKIALSDRLQQTEKYINTAHFAFETPLISALHNLEPKSIFFYPNAFEYKNNLGYQIPNYRKNTGYFSFSDTEYTVLSEPIIPRKLIFDVVCDTDSVKYAGKNSYYESSEDPKFRFHNVPIQVREVFSGKRSAYTGKNSQYAMTINLDFLQKADSVEISVWRKGSENGRLVVSDRQNPSAIWFSQQTTSEPDERGWQKLSSAFIVTHKTPLRSLVWNSNFKNETIFFDEFRIMVWRE